ncbi:sulfurtransferase TusA family protein [Metallosphaera hakonensis]|uniref:Sulfurtransferase TusA family protein n=1 Tax=Metallosphaera hakonensis JCM 8857 = DSM 7519 TaxID=1293036 RepID=A0A2U9IVL4_9CREN|nr:sulfurtransferase TusA family protein [Metallosphaera hakonensis]AWS00069.1 sulfurtransferase TusA family protein [Metallosphaera hakonensis JCM 8857 = DSM 7519]
MKEIETNEVCPVVILKVMREWRTVIGEEELVVKTPWEAVTQELQKWCAETGNEYLGHSKEKGKFIIRLKLKR